MFPYSGSPFVAGDAVGGAIPIAIGRFDPWPSPHVLGSIKRTLARSLGLSAAQLEAPPPHVAATSLHRLLFLIPAAVHVSTARVSLALQGSNFEGSGRQGNRPKPGYVHTPSVIRR
jgi:hypothetical protein